jgi:hypothetical protein
VHMGTRNTAVGRAGRVGAEYRWRESLGRGHVFRVVLVTLVVISGRSVQRKEESGRPSVVQRWTLG